MTSDQSTRLQAYQTTYDGYLAEYQAEVSDNYLAHNGQEKYPGHAAASDKSLAIKKLQMNTAKAVLDDYRAEIARYEAAQFAIQNPALAAEIQKNKDTQAANSGAAKVAAEAEAATKLFAQKNTQYLIIGGIVIAFLIVGVFAWKKFF